MRMLDYALAYAADGWSVLPLNGKVPITRHGYKDATTEEEQIREWFDKEDPPNIGIATGSVSGVCVLDVDPRNGGEESFRRILEGQLPHTVAARTGSGGSHWYFRYDSHPAKGVLAPGVDWCTDGGYVVAPPSIHPDTGEPYEWLEGDGHLGPREIVAIPRWVYKAAASGKRRKAGKRGGASEKPRGVLVEGGRNNALTRLGGAMRHWGFGQDSIESALLIHNEEACKPPLPQEEVERIAWSVSRYKPREVTSGGKVKKKGRVIRAKDSSVAEQLHARRVVAADERTTAGESRRRACGWCADCLAGEEGSCPFAVESTEGG